MTVSVGLLYYCIFYTGYISLFDWSGVGPMTDFTGLDNYLKSLQDPVFQAALLHTGVFFVATFLGVMSLGVIFAALLHSKLYFSTLFKILIFVPAVLATTTTAPVFRVIFAPDGTLNGMLRTIGLGSLALPWLATGVFPFLIIVGMQIWQSTGIVFVLYFAAMGQVESETLEAAKIDGAGNFRILVAIIMPSVRGTTVAVAILTAIAALKTFDIPFLVTNGGPNFSTEFLGTQIYRLSIGYSQVGLGAAMSIVLLLLALFTGVIISVGARRGRRSGV